MDKKNKILVFGGGTGMSCLLKGLKDETKNSDIDITSVVSVCDDGGSTGILRDELDMLAVGDIRRVLIALSETESLVEKLLNYRFRSNGSLDNHTVGNIMLAAATEMTGSVQQAVELLGNVLNLSGKILPVTESNVTLVGEMEDGSIITGEHNITKENKHIKNVFYKEQPVIKKELLEEIQNADLIVLSMGSLYTSLLPCLICNEIKDAIDNSGAEIVYVCNLFTQPGETDEFKVSDHINVINDYLGVKKINTVIANCGELDRELAKEYLAKEQKDPVELDVEYFSSLVDRVVIVDDLITIEDGVFRHDTEELAHLLIAELRKSIRNKYGGAKKKMIFHTNRNIKN